MYQHETSFRVRYGETDRMGYVYYGNYATYYEVGRVEALRSLGFSYRSLEDSGVLLPVSDFSVRYRRPAYYDDLLVLTTRIASLSGVRLRFLYELRNEAGDLLNEAETTLVFVSKATGRPCQPPDALLLALKKFLP
ncbi:MAG: acyl-CoA thioesterase [Bacteroidia bacterium]|jgi:acyl-CoA thioester hydrolase|nr:acyl-CoA thioesterase [Bacteroidia bacterium]MBP7269704.1 acyl-CoA thioesterase [Bacteroidia bacterium]MBP7438182.1 acyl-CoA thioesterase [Bacteroidia bacterium]MBP7770952.1 acyl-CoA thioesterase [Bacteroidia bacterium]